jgi:pyridoxamine 5'-phosphate oxidase family protein
VSSATTSFATCSASVAWRGSPRSARRNAAHRPVGIWSHNPRARHIDVTGHDFDRSKKYRDVRRNRRAAFVIDDIASANPWHVRGVEARGRAEALEHPHSLIRINPDRVVSWGLAASETPGR